MNIKIWLILLAVFAVMAGAIKYFYDGKQEFVAVSKRLETEKTNLQAVLDEAVKDNASKLEAMQAREQSLIEDRKELEDELNKLLELKKSDTCYISWHDVLLPDSVAMLLQ